MQEVLIKGRDINRNVRKCFELFYYNWKGLNCLSMTNLSSLFETESQVLGGIVHLNIVIIRRI